MDEYLEDSYQAWKQRQRMRGDVAKKRRRRLRDDGELTWAARGGAVVLRWRTAQLGPANA